MNPIFEELFNTYGDSVLHEIESGYNEKEINEQLEDLPLDKSTKFQLDTMFFMQYYRWSVNAFTLGLHLGLSLLGNNVRRPGPKKA